jgi:hypothetical protein
MLYSSIRRGGKIKSNGRDATGIWGCWVERSEITVRSAYELRVRSCGPTEFWKQLGRINKDGPVTTALTMSMICAAIDLPVTVHLTCFQIRVSRYGSCMSVIIRSVVPGQFVIQSHSPCDFASFIYDTPRYSFEKDLSILGE